MQQRTVTKCITDKDPASMGGMLETAEEFRKQVKEMIPNIHPFKQCLAFENVTDWLSRNVGTKLLFYAA